uniref:bifunctional 4-hydroxy-2-oxoglutarate aldolase/2-dehydro-3-deoxy-phosphogluconate aldolase n=1 Tax=Caldinitratiruptor microaerophilus TaxID=671077 RepID=UPI002231C717
MAVYRWEIARRIHEERVVAIVRAGSAEAALRAARAILEGGIRVLEVALTTPGGLEAIRALAGETDGALVGAGTVLDAETAVAAVRAGARFLVSPGLFPEVVRAGHRHGVPVLPGAATPTEIAAALEAGADLVKVFPASALGPGFVRAVREALPQAPLVPTGGVGADNAAEWLRAGAAALGVGGALTRGDPAGIAARARELVAAVRAAASGGT